MTSEDAVPVPDADDDIKAVEGASVEKDAERVPAPETDTCMEDSPQVVARMTNVEEAIKQQAPPNVPLTPPDDCIPVTQDGGVLKKILEPGEPGTKPSLHARCLIQYVGYLASTGELFMDTRKDRETEEPVVVVAGRTAAAQETGLCLAAATMAKGEKALVYIQDPSYGYGKVGSFSFPCVPPDSQLVYEVDMLNWEGIEETDNDQNRGSLLFEERLERAERRREAGNSLYKEGKYKEALAKYALALSYMDEDFMYQLEGHYLDKAEAVKLRIHLNMAAAQLNTRDYNTAIYNCGQVLNIEPGNVKALFRRGKARHALGRTEEALQDLEAALKIDPADKLIVAEMHALKGTMKKERDAQAALYKGRLKTSVAAPAAAGAVAATSPEVQPEAPSSSTSASAAAKADVSTAGSQSGNAVKRAAASAGAPKAGASGAKKQGGEAGAASKAGRQGREARTRAQGLVGILLWLWSMLVAALVGKQRRAVAERTRGR